MCGIAGVISSTNVVPKVYKALINLEYRGYDSCGIAVVNKGSIEVRKDSGTVEDVGRRQRFNEMSSTIGIGHTRWATTGIPNRNNSHPHTSTNANFALVHNGIISNYRELRDDLVKKGHVFKSETDTEVLVQLIEELYNKYKDLEIAVQMCTKLVEGTYAFAFITTYDPENIYCARNESPLLIGLGNGENFLGSDHNAILEYTRRIITLLDGEYAIINHHTVIIKKASTGEIVDHDISIINWDPELSKKGGFPHYMLKEIHEQPNTAETVLKIETKEIQNLAQTIHESDKTYLIGVGTTYYVSLIVQYYFSKLAGKFIPVVSSDEFPYLAEVSDKSLVIAFSQSGETYDTLNAIRHAKRSGSSTSAIINVIGSTMSREVDVPIMQGSGPEICVLSTKAASAQILLAIRVALSLGLINGKLSQSQYKKYLSELAGLPGDIRRVINETKGFVNNIATSYAHIKNWFFIGRGVYYGVAMESALKMKEVTYLHAEGIPGGFMKHGTISLIEEGFGSVFFIPPKKETDLYNHTIANAEEIKARKGLLIGIGFDHHSSLFDDQVRLFETSEINSPMVLLVLGQLLAYYTAVKLKRNVDKPRSLAKSVTVA